MANNESPEAGTTSNNERDTGSCALRNLIVQASIHLEQIAILGTTCKQASNYTLFYFNYFEGNIQQPKIDRNCLLSHSNT